MWSFLLETWTMTLAPIPHKNLYLWSDYYAKGTRWFKVIIKIPGVYCNKFCCITFSKKKKKSCINLLSQILLQHLIFTIAISYCNDFFFLYNKHFFLWFLILHICAVFHVSLFITSIYNIQYSNILVNTIVQYTSVMKL